MNYYNKEQLLNIIDQTFAFIEVAIADNVLTLTLNREEKRNALHPHMINEIAYVMNYAKVTNSIWSVVIQAKGKIFCAGADLKAFMGETGEFKSSIPEPNEQVLLGSLFPAVHKPIICKVDGDVYAGGFFFLTGSNYVVAGNHIKFGLPEVKRGIFPFQVMQTLLKVMPSRKVIDWCIRGYSLDASKALEYGLITDLVSDGNIEGAVQEIIQDLKANSPSAIRLGLEAYDKITEAGESHSYLREMLDNTIKTNDAQEGLLAFKEKRKPNWTGE